MISTSGPCFWTLIIMEVLSYAQMYLHLMQKAGIHINSRICYNSKKINRRVMKKNPLKNLKIMFKLNPYAKTVRRHAILKHDPTVSPTLRTNIPRWV